ncbi:MAG: hypothetical protein JRI23_25605, partial [Deltaproteobacteria bacterium]|nr:hypothetical protein [Deltaproteobacteria bacterium]MBW2535399.1 hypothetical protein [Deltaproteobacteria bacterium]
MSNSTIRSLTSIGLAAQLLAFGAGCSVGATGIDESDLSEGPGASGGKADGTAAECAALEQDPYVVTGVVQGGEDQGACLDTTMFRAVRLLRDADYVDAAYRYDFAGAQQALAATGNPELAASHYALAANVKHAGEFWVAEIPLMAGSMHDAYYLIEEFELKVVENLPPVMVDLLEQFLPEELAELQQAPFTAAHGMFRFSFQDGSPVVVKPQFPADPTRRDSFHELVLSVHAVSNVAGEYDPVEGMQDAYGTARGVYSVREKVDMSIGQLGNTIRQWRVELDSNTMRRILLAYLSRSTDHGLDDAYNTATRNCGSELFESLEDALGRRAGFEVRDLDSVDQIQ